MTPEEFREQNCSCRYEGDLCDTCHAVLTISGMYEKTLSKMEEVVRFYADHDNWFGTTVISDPLCGHIAYDIDPDDDNNALGRPTHGRFARAVLRGEDYEPPFDYSDWKTRYSEALSSPDD